MISRETINACLDLLAQCSFSVVKKNQQNQVLAENSDADYELAKKVRDELLGYLEGLSGEPGSDAS